MDLGSIFLILAVLILVALFISRPLMEGSRQKLVVAEPAVESQEHYLSSLMAERDRVLNALRELDFDAQLGKIPEDEYPLQRASLMQRGAEILRELDILQAAPIDASANSQIDPAAAVHPTDAPVSNALSDDRLEAMINARRSQRKESASGFCPRCGKPIQKSDRFCPKCGAVIASSSSHEPYDA